MNADAQNRPAALVTGAAVRIGRAIAEALAQRGYDIAIHYHTSKNEAEKLAEDIQNKGVNCDFFQADLSRFSEHSRLVERVKETFPHLNVLVNSASIFEKASLTDTEEDLFDRHFDINLKAPFFLCRDFARLIGQGQIINILDQRIARHHSTYFAYTLTKKTLAELTRMAATELAPKIRVNAIAPGYILPPAGQDRSTLEYLDRKIPLQQQGNLKQIQQAVHYLIENDFVTGQILYVDGGENL